MQITSLNVFNLGITVCLQGRSGEFKEGVMENVASAEKTAIVITVLKNELSELMQTGGFQ